MKTGIQTKVSSIVHHGFFVAAFGYPLDLEIKK